MALVPNRGGALVRRIAVYTLAFDVVVSLVIGLIISSILGWIVFIIGLLITGVIYWNFRSVMRMRGMR